MLDIQQVNFIDYNDWNDLVINTYKKPYNLQQTEGCLSRGIRRFTVPGKAYTTVRSEDLPEIVNHEEIEVSLDTWLKKNPNDTFVGGSDLDRRLWWFRTFYPNFQELANDLYDKGLLPAGDYIIEID
jgi:hypothetical protein